MHREPVTELSTQTSMALMTPSHVITECFLREGIVILEAIHLISHLSFLLFVPGETE